MTFLQEHVYSLAELSFSSLVLFLSYTTNKYIYAGFIKRVLVMEFF